MHIWARLPYSKSYTLYNQYENFRIKYIPKEYQIIDDEKTLVDPFSEAENPSQIRPIIVEKQHKAIPNSFNKLNTIL